MVALDEKSCALHANRHPRGSLLGILPTGRKIEVNEIHIYRLKDGKAVEHRAGRDDLGAMRQLGVIADAVPEPGAPRGSRGAS